MGTWKIEIKGTGCHHNKGRKDDAERLAAQMVLALRAAGHDVRGATFALTSTGPDGEAAQPDGVEDIGSAPTEYLAAKEASDLAP